MLLYYEPFGRRDTLRVECSGSIPGTENNLANKHLQPQSRTAFSLKKDTLQIISLFSYLSLSVTHWTCCSKPITAVSPAQARTVFDLPCGKTAGNLMYGILVSYSLAKPRGKTTGIRSLSI